MLSILLETAVQEAGNRCFLSNSLAAALAAVTKKNSGQELLTQELLTFLSQSGKRSEEKNGNTLLEVKVEKETSSLLKIEGEKTAERFTAEREDIEEQEDESLEEKDLEDEDSEDKNLKSRNLAKGITERVPVADYLFEGEEFFLGQLYKIPPLDYLKLFYGERSLSPPSFAQGREYSLTPSQVSDTSTESLTAEEARDTLIEIQYAAAAGTPYDVNSEQRKKFDFWIKFNPALFKLYETMHGVTSEVNYGLLN